jgi:hypothetical protein
LRSVALWLAILGIAFVGIGTFRLWRLNPNDHRYTIREAAALKAPDQKGLENFLEDQRRALFWVLVGTLAQFVAVTLTAFDTNAGLTGS